MACRIRALVPAVVLAVTPLAGHQAAAEFRVGVQIGIPAPPPIILSGPPLVVVPGVPTVRYAPSIGFDLFIHGGRHYAWHGGWFVAAGFRQPWTFIDPVYVPAAIRALPRPYHVDTRHYRHPTKAPRWHRRHTAADWNHRLHYTAPRSPHGALGWHREPGDRGHHRRHDDRRKPKCRQRRD